MSDLKYVQRDGQDRIVGVFANPQPGIAEEALPADQAVLWTPANPVPQSVTPRQARLALLAAGLLDQVEAAIAAGPRADRITWEFAAEVRRDYAMIANLGASLGLTAGQIDDLFRAAAAL